MRILPSRPKVNMDPVYEPFFTALANGEFQLLRCAECGEWYWPVAYCRNHNNLPFLGNMQWERASGKGSVFTYNVQHIAFDSAFKGQLPLVYALVELDEGPLFASNVVDCPPDDVSVGMAVEVEIAQVNSHEDYFLPVFHPAQPA